MHIHSPFHEWKYAISSYMIEFALSYCDGKMSFHPPSHAHTFTKSYNENMPSHLLLYIPPMLNFKQPPWLILPFHIKDSLPSKLSIIIILHAQETLLTLIVRSSVLNPPLQAFSNSCAWQPWKIWNLSRIAVSIFTWVLREGCHPIRFPA